MIEKSTYIRSEYQYSVIEHPCSDSEKKPHVTTHPKMASGYE